MNIVVIFFGLLILGAIAVGAVLVLAACIAFITGRWKLGVVLILGCCPVGFLPLLGYSLLGEDTVVREPVTVGELVGAYHLEPVGVVNYLSAMGYKDFSGQIILHPNGQFTATRVPACCLHGQDETTQPFTGGYYRFSGTWTIDKGSSSAYGVRFDVRSSELSDQPSNSDAALLESRQFRFQSLDTTLWKGAPPDIAFRIYTGGDFNYIVWRRSGS